MFCILPQPPTLNRISEIINTLIPYLALHGFWSFELASSFSFGKHFTSWAISSASIRGSTTKAYFCSLGFLVVKPPSLHFLPGGYGNAKLLISSLDCYHPCFLNLPKSMEKVLEILFINFLSSLLIGRESDRWHEFQSHQVSPSCLSPCLKCLPRSYSVVPQDMEHLS